MSTTQKCPHCAETIKAEANICRYCQRDVRANHPGDNPKQFQTRLGAAFKDIALRLVAFVILSAITISSLFWATQQLGKNMQDSIKRQQITMQKMVQENKVKKATVRAKLQK